jgi:hypothetical protein
MRRHINFFTDNFMLCKRAFGYFRVIGLEKFVYCGLDVLHRSRERLNALRQITLPTTDGRILEMRRDNQPELEQRIILDKLKVKLPKQLPPKVYSHQLNAQLCGGN